MRRRGCRRAQRDFVRSRAQGSRRCDEIPETLDLGRAVAEFVRVVEVRKVAAGKAGVRVDKRLDDLGVDLVADVAVSFERNHVLEASTRGNVNGRSEVVRVSVFIGDVFDEQHEQDVVLVLAGIHAATQFIARRPESGVEFRFFNGHRCSIDTVGLKPCGYFSLRRPLHWQP
jgi:hypothetical protein